MAIDHEGWILLQQLVRIPLPPDGQDQRGGLMLAGVSRAMAMGLGQPFFLAHVIRKARLGVDQPAEVRKRHRLLADCDSFRPSSSVWLPTD